MCPELRLWCEHAVLRTRPSIIHYQDFVQGIFSPLQQDKYHQSGERSHSRNIQPPVIFPVLPHVSDGFSFESWKCE